MPDITTTQTTEAPPPEDGWRPDLAELRARLDAFDDNIHDLLMARARVVESVARSGKPAAFRPGREASILRRLLARHTGHLPPQTIVRMWREMLAGTTAMQTPVSVAVFGTLDGIAREHFGFLTPVITHPSAEAALAVVRSGGASAAVLPFPAGGEPWWQMLTRTAPRLFIVGRLPFWTGRPANVPDTDALVVAATAPDASGHDRSFIALSQVKDIADFRVHAMHGTVAEVEGMITGDDKRLPRDAVVLGGYAIPVAGENS